MRSAFLFFWLTGLVIFGAAQSANVTLIAHLDDYPILGYSDCWGYTDSLGRDYALLGANTGVSIVDVTDPNNVAEVDFVPFVAFSWYDIKTLGHYMYVTSEGTTDVLIVDLSTLPDSARIVGTYSGLTTTPHNNFVDQEQQLLFLVEDFNFNNPVRIVSLADPVNPVELSVLGIGLGTDAHDVFSQDSVLYVAEGSNPTIGIFDISDPANPALLRRVPVPTFGYVHNVWVSEDNHYLVSTEETPDHTVKLWDISDLNNVQLVSEYLGDSRLAHNAYIKDGYVFLSHYESGLKIVDVSNPNEMVEVGFYDTYPQGEGPGFNGAWGVYPFASNGLIFVSDIQTGLYVLQFDSVRAGGIEGVVSDAATGMPIEGVDIEFVEARKSTTTDAGGFYALRTFEGTHTIIFSKRGYFEDTLSVTLPSGPSITMNVALTPNPANIAVSPDSIGVTLPVDTTFTTELVVSNVGPGGRLDYIADDVNGPLPPAAPSRLPDPEIWNLTVDLSGVPRVSEAPAAVPTETTGDTIIVDPAGDLLFGTGGDMIFLFATLTPTEVTFEFEFLNPIDTDSTIILFSLDTDFDPNTGAFPGGFGANLPAQNIGAEWDVLVDVPGFFSNPPIPETYYIWPGANTPPTGPPVAFGSATVSGNLLTLTIPLSVINDDGNLAVAGLGGHLDPNAGLTSLDYLPDVGHGEVGVNPLGDLPWLSITPTGGSLMAGESDTIQVTFDTHGLDPEQTFTGYIAIFSNDADEPVVAVPITLITQPPVGIEEKPGLAQRFELFPNHPNPFNPTTTIRFTIPEARFATLKVYDLLGREIRTLVSEKLTPGEYKVQWDGTDASGHPVVSGVYFYRLEAGDFVRTRKMLLVR